MPPYQDQNGNQPDGFPPQPGAVPPASPQGPYPTRPDGYPVPGSAPAPQQVPTLPAPTEYQQPPTPVQSPTPQQQGSYRQPGPYPTQPGMQSPQDNPYSFFLEQKGSSKPKLGGGGGGNSMVMRLIIVLGGLTALIIIGTVVYSMLFNAPDNTDRLVAVANDQQELIRVSDLGLKNVDDGQLQNFTVTAKMSLLSSQQDLITHLGKVGTKVDPEKLTLSQDPKVDEALKAAETANTYDATFSSIMRGDLAEYESKLNLASQAATGQAEKDLLAKQQAAAQLLIKQLGGDTAN